MFDCFTNMRKIQVISVLYFVIFCQSRGANAFQASFQTPSKISRPRVVLSFWWGQQGQDVAQASSSSLPLHSYHKKNIPLGNLELPEDLVERAQLFVSTDFGLQDGADRLLDDNDFIWIGGNNQGEVYGKSDYLAAGKFFAMRTAFPDWNYRPHDYRIDERDQNTVRLTCRAMGIMKGPLRLRRTIQPPNGQLLVSPPEAFSISFGGTNGTVTKLCTGFALDRLVGNTEGLTGVMAAAKIAKSPLSPLEIYPLVQVWNRFWGRPIRPLPMEPQSFLAPFPETVMIQLAKGILLAVAQITDATLPTLDPDLWSDQFTYWNPMIGRYIGKQEFMQRYASTVFGGAEPDFTHFRVDPYDPYRVWVDVQLSGVFEDDAVTFETPLQAMSITLDDKGYCVRMTADAVMDPTLGNTGGLPGIEGIKYAAGSPSPGIYTRTLPQLLGRLRKRLLEPFTGLGVDVYYVGNEPQNTSSYLNKISFSQEAMDGEVIKTRLQQAADDAKRIRAEAVLAANAKREFDREARKNDIRNAQRKQELAVQKATASSRPIKEKIPSKSRVQQNKSPRKPWNNIPQIQWFQDFRFPIRETKNAEPSRKNVISKFKTNFNLNQIFTISTTQSKKTGIPDDRPIMATRNKNEKLSLSDKKSRESKSSQQRSKMETVGKVPKQGNNIKSTANAKIPTSTKSKLKPTPPSKPPPQAAFAMYNKMQFSRTIALPKKNKDNSIRTKVASPSKSTKTTTNYSTRQNVSIPNLQKWRKNRDGSLTGYVFGSTQFSDNERITTSPIVQGNISAGDVVITTSGSKYLLG